MYTYKGWLLIKCAIPSTEFGSLEIYESAMDNSSGQITAESISKFVGVPAKLISQDIVKIAQVQ